MRRTGAALICLAALLAAEAVFAQTTGVARLTDLWRLPLLEPGVLSFGESSHDPSGGNQDGFLGLYSRLYKENGLNVLFDAPGPGCIYRLWFTRLGFGSRLVAYVDDSPTPAIDQSLAAFFSGRNEPFTQPLVWNDLRSSGGFVSYVPLCYAKRLVLGTTGRAYFYNFTAHAYRGDVAVASFTGDEDYAAARASYDPARAGSDPKGLDGVEFHRANVVVGPGESATLFAAQGAGQIASLRLTPATPGSEALQNVRLIARFDGAASAAADLPLTLFFGASEEGAARALLFGRADGVLYSFFPMPFFASVELALANDGPEPYSFAAEIGVLPQPPDDRAALFETVRRESNPPVVGQDHLFVQASGQGRIVGIVQLSAGRSGLSFLEGDERFYADGLRTPTIQGTGTEDYYNGGWYFNEGTFNLPTHGHPLHLETGTWSIVGMYRLHVADSLEFNDGVRFSIEHDALDLAVDESYQSCAFLYRIDEAALILDAEFDVGDGAAEAAFAYQGSGDAPTGQQQFYYEGDFDQTPFVDSGYRTTGAASFAVRVNPGADGVRLVRRIDQSAGRELVRVWVNGADAGLWGTPERNWKKRWRDTVFDISPAFTHGAERLEIALENAAPERSFTQYRYWVYSWKRPLLSRLQGLTLSAPESSMKVGESLQLAVVGPYPSGAEEEVTTWVGYDLDDPDLASVEYGRLQAKREGELTVTARAGELLSNAVTIQIAGAAPADDDDDDDAGADDDGAAPPPADDDHETGARCGC